MFTLVCCSKYTVNIKWASVAPTKKQHLNDTAGGPRVARHCTCMLAG